jgi:dephospho-CoA kinase
MARDKISKVVFVDSEGVRWTENNLKELVEALIEKKKTQAIIDYYF